MSDNKRKVFEDFVWDRVEKLIKKKNIKQTQLAKKCKEIGMPVAQPELSKLYNGSKKINLYELTAISKALNVSIDSFVADSAPCQENILNSRQSNKLLNSVHDEAFFSFLGEYYIYYNTTSEQEDKVQRGKMAIGEEKEGYCKVELFIHTGIYKDKKETVKAYEGRMLIATLLSGAYIVVRNDSIGELCFMVMRHRTFMVKQVECRIALCLTVGTGENKLPTAHRMLISRKNLSDDQVQLIQPYFDLYGNVIRIEKRKARELVRALSEKVDKDAWEALLRILPEKEYYELSIELLRRHLNLDREKLAIFIADLLRAADTEPYAKIYETDDNLTYAIIKEVDAFENGISSDG